MLHAEQGLGDTIQFCRYVRLVSELGARVLLGAPQSMSALLSTMQGDFTLLAGKQPLPHADFQCPLGSLPLALGTMLGSIPSEVPYLAADPQRVQAWAQRLGSHGFRIGICWQGSTHKIDEGRSFPLKHFEALARLPGVRLISLHKGAGEDQLASLPRGMCVELPGEGFDEGGDAFVDTAAVMANCDLIVSSDTAVAHLAGALGRPVWVALKSLPDWRWMLEREDSPWYPSMRLFRQQVQGDWDEVFAAIVAALRLPK